MATDPTTELKDIEKRLAAAWAAGDPSVHEQVLADNWTVIDPTGRVITKADVIAEAFSDDREINKCEIDEENVRLLGDNVAVVTGLTKFEGRIKGQSTAMSLRFTDIFERQNGEWKCVASQGTFVNQ